MKFGDILDKFVYDIFLKIVPFCLFLGFVCLGYAFGNVWALFDIYYIPGASLPITPRIIGSVIGFIFGLVFGRMAYNDI